MFHTHSQRKGFGFYPDSPRMQESVNIAGGMACGQNDGIGKPFLCGIARGFGRNILCDYARDSVVFQDKIGDQPPEMYLATVVDNGFADILDHTGQFVGADMRVRLGEDIGFGAVFHQQAQGFAQVATFGRASVQFAVGVGACAAFAEAVIGVRIYLAELLDSAQVAASGASVLAAVEYDRLNAQFDQFKCGEITRRPCADDKHPTLFPVHRAKALKQGWFRDKRFSGAVHVYPQAENGVASASIKRGFLNFNVQNFFEGEARLSGGLLPQTGIVVAFLRVEYKFDCGGHGVFRFYRKKIENLASLITLGRLFSA